MCLQSLINWSNDEVVSEQLLRCGEKRNYENVSEFKDLGIGIAEKWVSIAAGEIFFDMSVFFLDLLYYPLACTASTIWRPETSFL